MTRVNLFDVESAAHGILAGAVWDYYSSGADDEVTLRENRAAFERISLNYRVLVDVRNRRLERTVLGQKLSIPVIVAPTAFHGLAHPEGELATARAAEAVGTIMTLSTLSNTSVEAVARSTRAPLWFQLYVYKDRGATRALVDRVEAAGCRALVLTVDAPVLGRRERDMRNQFRLPDGLRVENLHARGFGDLPSAGSESGLAAYFATLLDSGLTWPDIEWLRSITKLPVIVKGIVRADDAMRAVDHGAAAVVVSNHGGRQLDTAPATIDVLEGIVSTVAGRAEVLLDGGVRRGTDVLKALALGARAVLLGRPVLWGLAVGGEAGVREVFEILRDEIDRSLALLGCSDVADVSRDFVSQRPR
jgi:4-hydroxymandelate oxidase